jgi:ribosomal RNA assembly protein
MTTEYAYEIKIPKERIAVLIGKKGEIKKTIEEETKTKIDVDSKEGDVTIKGEDAINLLSAREIINAIGRGFNPEIARQLLKQDYILEIIGVQDFAGKSKSNLDRLKGRVIGKEGKSRRLMEDLTDTNISVYGKTIAIIGLPEDATNARRAIEMLLRGSMHSAVYKMLERKRAQNKQADFEINETKEGEHFG